MASAPRFKRVPRFQYSWSQLRRVFYVHRQARTGSKLRAAGKGVGETGHIKFRPNECEAKRANHRLSRVLVSVPSSITLYHYSNSHQMFALFSPEFKRKLFVTPFCNPRGILIYFSRAHTRIGLCSFAKRNNCSQYEEDGAPGLRTSDSTRKGWCVPAITHMAGPRPAMCPTMAKSAMRS